MTPFNPMRRVSWALASFLVLIPPMAPGSEAKVAASAYSMSELLKVLLQTPFPLESRAFSELGVSGFSQVGSNRSLNSEFRSDPVMTRDGATLAFLAYRVRPQDRNAVNFFFIQMADDSCYPMSKLDGRYELKEFIAPPNPHSGSVVDSVNRNLYRAAYSGGELMVRLDGTSKRCVVSLSRSRY